MTDTQVKKDLIDGVDGAKPALLQMGTVFWLSIVGAVGTGLTVIAPDFVNYVLTFVPDSLDDMAGKLLLGFFMTLAAVLQSRAANNTKTAVVDALSQTPTPAAVHFAKENREEKGRG